MMKTILTLLFIGGAVALFLLYTKPAYDGLGTTRDKIEQYNLALDKAAELQRLKQSLLSQYNSFNPSDIERLHKLLPDHVDNVRLILDLDTLASKHGLALQNVAISGAESKGPAAEEVINPVADEHGEITIGFATTGTYERFVTFLTDLEQSLRIVDVIDLKITPATTVGEPSYNFSIVLRTYWLK